MGELYNELIAGDLILKNGFHVSQVTIAVLVGSLRNDSFNRMLSEGLVKLAPDNHRLVLIALDRLPLYNQDNDANPVVEVKAFKETVSKADGVMFITPEYNRSIPGVLKNAIDHGSRPYGQSVWAKKPAGIIGVSTGAAGTAMAQQHLRNILAHLDMPTLGQPEAFMQAKAELFDESGNIAPPSIDFLQRWMNSFVAWVDEHTINRAAPK